MNIYAPRCQEAKRSKYLTGKRSATYESLADIKANNVCPLLGIANQGEIKKLNVNAKQEPTTSLLEDVPLYPTLTIPLFKPARLIVKLGQENGFPNCSPMNTFNIRLNAEYNNLRKRCKAKRVEKLISDLEEHGKISKELLPFKKIVKERCQAEMSEDLSKISGNLGKVLLDGKPYLIHCQGKDRNILCLSRVAAKRKTKFPAKICYQTYLQDDCIYEIRVSRRSDGKETTFATRQRHATSLWKPSCNEDGAVNLSLYDHQYDDNSFTKSVDINPIIPGELCELRTNMLCVSRQCEIIYHRKLDECYRICHYGNHPQSVLLAGERKIDFADMRMSGSMPLQNLFSLNDDNLKMFYSLQPSETISCFTPSSKKYVYYIGTESSILLWDQRMNNRPLLKASHLMDHSPVQVCSIELNSDSELSILGSRSWKSSGYMVLDWSNQELVCSKFDISILTPSLKNGPATLAGLRSSLDYLKSQGMALDWSVQNRFEQPTLGFASHYSDQCAWLWTSTAAGDVYEQQLKINEDKKLKPPSKRSMKWVSKWTQEVRAQNPRLPVIRATEIYDGSSVLEELQIEGSSEECIESEDELELPSFLKAVEDLSNFRDERSKKYLSLWETEIPETKESVLSVSTPNVSQDFQQNLFSSTPFHKTKQPRIEMDWSF